ncbi:MAG: hypothetical protein AAF125_03670 [Chloroflexota bacterium]
MLASSGFAFGALACAWAFYLGTTSGGEQVSVQTGLSYYAGWICGMGFTLLGVLFSALSVVTRTLGTALDNFGDGDGNAELSDLIPGGGGGGGNLGGLGAIVGGTVISRFLGNRD